MRAIEIGSGYTSQTPAARTRGRVLRGAASANRRVVFGEDGFDRGTRGGSEYTDYNRRGEYTTAGIRILPDRYYEDPVIAQTRVLYRGGSIAYLDLLEEAVRSGEVTLDEAESIMHNVSAAEKALIFDRAAPLYPWSTTLYSNDGQYVLHTVDGSVTGKSEAFYEDPNARKVTAQYLAEQLASGVRPAELDGDASFLARIDDELYAKALKMGEIKRKFETADRAFAVRQLPKEQYLEDVHLILLYFLGRDDGLRGAAHLRRLTASPEFGRKALLGTLSAPPETVYRRPVKVEPLPVADRPRSDRTRRRLTPA